MDTVGTFDMALALFKHKMFTAIHKHYTIEEWRGFMGKAPKGIENFIAVSTGTSGADFNFGYGTEADKEKTVTGVIGRIVK